ncbi:amino acid transporter [Coniella lustricola]|uniref:Amino acid transporter n=1 Tax=Coniella lustricola TaxID=2025994 RepID=A0A2T3A9B7_9PEZI|nr:amino acid transporter [Coniella lustricola]
MTKDDTQSNYSPPLEKKASANDAEHLDLEYAAPTGRARWLGGPEVTVGRRISPVLASLQSSYSSDSDESSGAILHKQKEAEASATIQYRTCSWQKTAALLFSEYICLAIMSFPWSYSILGLVPGLIFTVVVAMFVQYTSLIVWEFCLRHPEVRDVCDVGEMIFWNKRWAWWFSAVMFILNNTFIQGLHVLVGAKYLNTMTASDDDVSCRTVSFSVLMFLVCWVCSLPRTFDGLAKLGAVSAAFTFISVLLATIFAGIQSHPAGWTAELGDPLVLAVPLAGTTFVSGLNAFLNISYTFIGQITLPSFIAEMKDPRDFPKALWLCTIGEIIVFSLVGAIVYAYVGTNYITAPAFGSLQPVFKKVAFSFMIPTLIFLGVLYASVSARLVFFRVFKDSKHKNEHTVIGWASWAGILLVTWIFAFIISQVIPFFSDLLSLMSALFDSFFGFIFWGVAYFRMRKADGGWAFIKSQGFWGYAEAALNVLIILIGIFFVGPGTYASVESIITDFDPSQGSVFTCASNGL